MSITSRFVVRAPPSTTGSTLARTISRTVAASCARKASSVTSLPLPRCSPLMLMLVLVLSNANRENSKHKTGQ